MNARTRPPRRQPENFQILAQLAAEHAQLMQQTAPLRDSDRLAEARRLFRKTETVFARLQLLEATLRIPFPHG